MHLAIDDSNNRTATLAIIKASGADVLICKATEGDSFDDATLASQRAIAKKLGIRFGSFVFLHATSKGDEAAHYLQYAKPEPDELVIIDSESGGQDGATIAQMAARTNACALELEKHGYAPILYASSSYWTQLVAAVPALKRLRVWEAQYPGTFTRWLPRLAALRVKLGRGATCVMWQWTDSFLIDGQKYDASAVLVDPKKL